MSSSPDHRDRVRSISRAIRDEEARLRARWPLLGHQDLIGGGLYLGAWLLMALVAIGWLGGLLPFWATIPLMALPMSVLHELEHDLIHDLYFPRRDRVQGLLFLGIWLAKASLDPWTRRGLHLQHHKRSGQKDDVEERLIGLGMRWGPRRLLLSLLPAASGLALARLDPALVQRSFPGGPRRWLTLAFMALPFALIPLALLGAPLAAHACVLWLLPGMLRHTAIVLVSSNSHYAGDIAPNDIYVQNQLLRHPLTWPLQLFCWGFGATHVIHHYVVPQPFYLRTLVYFGVRDALVAQGVRVDDLGSIVRGNRWGATA